MSSDEVERTLKAMPVRTLSSDADTEIIAAIRAAAGRTHPWYARPIPFWQAFAACLVLCTATWLLGGAGRISTAPQVDSSATSKPSSVVVRLDEPLFREASSSLDRMDVSRWQFCMSPITEQ